MLSQPSTVGECSAQSPLPAAHSTGLTVNCVNPEVYTLRFQVFLARRPAIMLLHRTDTQQCPDLQSLFVGFILFVVSVNTNTYQACSMDPS